MAKTIPGSAHGATVPQCTNDTQRCYQTTVYALEQSEEKFGQVNMVAPFVQACEDLMHGVKFPPQADCEGEVRVQ